MSKVIDSKFLHFDAKVDKNASLSLGKLKWGIIGAGGIATVFTRSVLKNGGNIFAVASRSQEKAQKFIDQFNFEYATTSDGAKNSPRIKKAYGSYEELLADPEIDVIYVANPHSEHHEWAIKALEAGKPVLCEKSIARNAKEAREIYAKAKEKGLFCMEAMWTRFLPHILELQKVITSGQIGEILAVQADFGIQKDYSDINHRLFNPDLAGGALLDLGIYPVSFAQMILGTPDKVIASGVLTPNGVDANSAIIYEYSSGARALLHTTNLAVTPTVASITGTKGRIEVSKPFYRPSTFKVTLNTGEVYQYNARVEQEELLGKEDRFGMEFEAAEVECQILAGNIESPKIPHQTSIDIMEICDEIRAQLDFKFPGE
jgi:predicted dehydrogenase